MNASTSNLQSINSDYEAKRFNNMTLNPPKIHQAREMLFYDWLKKEGQTGRAAQDPKTIK